MICYGIEYGIMLYNYPSPGQILKAPIIRSPPALNRFDNGHVVITIRRYCDPENSVPISPVTPGYMHITNYPR